MNDPIAGEFTLAECATVVRWLRRAPLLNVVRNWLKARGYWPGVRAGGGTEDTTP